MSQIDAHHSLDRRGAALIESAFQVYHVAFRRITRRARSRFEQMDWHRMQQDSLERLELYSKVLDGTVANVRSILGECTTDKAVWARMKASYASMIADRTDIELAETFFNSVGRRIFSTIGVDPRIEFVALDFTRKPAPSRSPIYRTYAGGRPTAELVENILEDYRFAVDYEDMMRDTRLAAAEIDSRLTELGAGSPIEAVDVLKPVFFRNKGAYVIGRMRTPTGIVPLVLALLNSEGGVTVDAALVTENEASIVCSFTRSYFHVEVDRPWDAIEFLKSIMPLKPIAELYISLGYNRHGKTMLFRDLLAHLETSEDKFVSARGEKGMVMLVFTLPSYDLVFKVIRDRFGHSKKINRNRVIEKYQLVFRRDRGGRLIDAQQFEHLRFDRRRFSEELLDELAREATDTVEIDAHHVNIRHLYTERRVTPLNIYLTESDEASGRDATLDYGQALKDLAATNIFVGDILLKNFGVTRHGRVVCYDYDELTLLQDCRFRDLPQMDEYGGDSGEGPSFFVDENDIFPEEFMTFLGLPEVYRGDFVSVHGDLLRPAFYRRMQQRHREGDVIEIFPYHPRRRLRNGAGGPPPSDRTGDGNIQENRR